MNSQRFEYKFKFVVELCEIVGVLKIEVLFDVREFPWIFLSDLEYVLFCFFIKDLDITYLNTFAVSCRTSSNYISLLVPSL